MPKESTLKARITFSLASAGLGAVLLASPWLGQAENTPAGVASAVFLGALLVRLGLSGAVRPRTWKPKARLTVGAAILALACITGPGDTPLPLGLLYAMGLITVALGATELRLAGGGPAQPATADRPALGDLFLPGRWTQSC